MAGRWPGVAAAGSPLAAVLPLQTMPWPAHFAVALSGPAAYILHEFWAYRLSRRAMECAERSDVVEVLAYGTRQPPSRRRQSTRRLSAGQASEHSR